MPKRKLNVYEIKQDYCVGICSDGTRFLFDIDDFEKIREYTWRNQRGIIYTNLRNPHSIALSRFILGLHGKERVFFYNKNSLDCRKSNLYYGNQIIDKGDYCEVYCYDGSKFLIDSEDKPFVEQYRWHLSYDGYPMAKNNDTKQSFKLHRVLMGLTKEDKIEVDHINRNATDNRKSNLRLANRSENCSNKSLQKSNKSGVCGVYWNKSANKWCVQISKDNHRYYLGSYADFDEAVQIRRNAEIDFFGSYRPV